MIGTVETRSANVTYVLVLSGRTVKIANEELYLYVLDFVKSKQLLIGCFYSWLPIDPHSINQLVLYTTIYEELFPVYISNLVTRLTVT